MLNNNSNCICIYIFNENCKQKSMSAKMHQHFKTFKSISKLTACVVNCCKCLQPWSKFLQVLSTACKCLQDETPAECMQNEIPAESFKRITSMKASKKCKNCSKPKLTPAFACKHFHTGLQSETASNNHLQQQIQLQIKTSSARYSKIVSKT